jgi:hypothetical protein
MDKLKQVGKSNYWTTIIATLIALNTTLSSVNAVLGQTVKLIQNIEKIKESIESITIESITNEADRGKTRLPK